MVIYLFNNPTVTGPIKDEKSVQEEGGEDLKFPPPESSDGILEVVCSKTDNRFPSERRASVPFAKRGYKSATADEVFSRRALPTVLTKARQAPPTHRRAKPPTASPQADRTQ